MSRVQSLGSRIEGLGFSLVLRVQGSGSRIEGLGFRFGGFRARGDTWGKKLFRKSDP